jgi:hypothetical protein
VPRHDEHCSRLIRFIFQHILHLKVHPIPYAAPSIGAFVGNSPLGVRQGCRTLPEGQGCPFWQTPINARSAGSKRHPGRLFFGYFLLAKQKKVSRPWVREPTFKSTVALATPYYFHIPVFWIPAIPAGMTVFSGALAALTSSQNKGLRQHPCSHNPNNYANLTKNQNLWRRS